jgi:uncharacterized protein (TIGR02246 family)
MQDDERKAIEAVLASYGEAWRSRDMDRWGALFTPDSDFITWRGACWTSRDENVAAHKAVPPAIADQMPNYQLTLAGLALLSDSIALVHAEWFWPRFVEAGQAPEDRRGVITMVLVKRDGQWRIRASQNSRIIESDSAYSVASSPGDDRA